jgi:hypothetical protein
MTASFPASRMDPTGFDKSLTFNNDILVVGSANGTYIFDLQIGAISIREEIYLEQ